MAEHSFPHLSNKMGFVLGGAAVAAAAAAAVAATVAAAVAAVVAPVVIASTMALLMAVSVGAISRMTTLAGSVESGFASAASTGSSAFAAAPLVDLAIGFLEFALVRCCRLRNSDGV